MTCRAPEGPIPWTAAVAYADRKGLSVPAAELLWTVVRRMDAVERRWTYEAIKQEAGIG